MLESTRKTANLNRLKMIGSVLVFAIALTAWLICQFKVGSEKLGFPAILILFAIIFGLGGISQLAFMIASKSKFSFVTGYTSTVIGLIFVLIMCKVVWWAIVIISIMLLFCGAFSTFAIAAPELVVEFDNAPDSGYKNYKERKATEDTMPKEEKELPKLKSFKD